MDKEQTYEEALAAYEAATEELAKLEATVKQAQDKYQAAHRAYNTALLKKRGLI
jgi:outer membrane protein TolC